MYLSIIILSIFITGFCFYLYLPVMHKYRLIKQTENRYVYITAGFALIVSAGFFLVNIDYRILIVCLCLALIGFYDDIKNSSPYGRLIIEFLAGIIMFLLYCSNDLFRSISIYAFFLFVFSTIISINAFNMTDNIDELASSVAIISLLFFFLISGDLFILYLIFALFYFLFRYNRKPSKMFLGDTGSLSIGFLLFYVGVYSVSTVINNIFLIILFTLLIIGYPIIDFFHSIYRRLKIGQNPMVGDRNHISHQLLKNNVQAVPIICLFQVILCSLVTIILFLL